MQMIKNNNYYNTLAVHILSFANTSPKCLLLSLLWKNSTNNNTKTNWHSLKYNVADKTQPPSKEILRNTEKASVLLPAFNYCIIKHSFLWKNLLFFKIMQSPSGPKLFYLSTAVVLSPKHHLVPTVSAMHTCCWIAMVVPMHTYDST